GNRASVQLQRAHLYTWKECELVSLPRRRPDGTCEQRRNLHYSLRRFCHRRKAGWLLVWKCALGGHGSRGHDRGTGKAGSGQQYTEKCSVDCANRVVCRIGCGCRHTMRIDEEEASDGDPRNN